MNKPKDSKAAEPAQTTIVPAVDLPRLVRLRWDDPKWWPARCPECGWEGMSNETEGGHQIADTGDYDDPVCPKCCHADEGRFMGKWIPVVEIPEPNAKVEARDQ